MAFIIKRLRFMDADNVSRFGGLWVTLCLRWHDLLAFVPCFCRHSLEGGVEKAWAGSQPSELPLPGYLNRCLKDDQQFKVSAEIIEKGRERWRLFIYNTSSRHIPIHRLFIMAGRNSKSAISILCWTRLTGTWSTSYVAAARAREQQRPLYLAQLAECWPPIGRCGTLATILVWRCSPMYP